MDERIKSAALAGTAFAVGIGGTAVADQLLTGGDIKDGSIKLKDLANSVRDDLDQKGPKGPQGPQGPQGLPGPAGGQGLQGPPGVGSLLLGGRILSTALTGDPSFNAVIGGGGGSLAAGGVTEPSVQIAAPQGTVSVSDLRVRLSAAPFDNLTFTLRVNGVNTAVSCAVTTIATPSCDSAGASAAVSPNDLLSLGVVTAGTKTPVTASFSLDLNLSG
jgi:hypothetical protein